MAYFEWYTGWGQLNMLISMDLMKFLARDLEPAQLCLARVTGTDNRYILRVRYGDTYLDYPLEVPLLPTAEEVTKKCNFDLVHDCLVAMAKLVVPPSAYESGIVGKPAPCVISPTEFDGFIRF